MLRRRRLSSAFTLIELLVVVAIIALLISILLPSLRNAREQAKTVVCLANLRSMGQAVALYASGNNDALPARLHPAVYRYQNKDVYEEDYGMTGGIVDTLMAQQLTTFLRRTLNESATYKTAAIDKIASCPKLSGIIPDEMFLQLWKQGGHQVFPTHYVLNHWGTLAQEGDGVGVIGNARPTNPQYYFGFKDAPGTNSGKERLFPGRRLSEVKRPAEEWMMADAWYRKRTGPAELQQEGPYQSEWSGSAFPPFAPHGTFRSYRYGGSSDDSARTNLGIAVRNAKGDGTTGTAFFDGHADSVRSKEFIVGDFSILYGFPGTVNPLKQNPAATSAIWSGYWR